MSRVMISAISIVSPIGTGRDEFFSGIEKNVSGTGVITCFHTDFFPVALGAEARVGGGVIAGEEGTDRRELFNEIALGELFRCHSLDRYASDERVLIAGCGVDFFRLAKYAESKDLERHCWQRYSNNSCLMFARYAQQFKISGGTIVNASACVASSQAIGLAFRMLSKGDKKCIIAGGVDSMLNPLHYMGFYKLGALSDWKGDPGKSCRPFDRDRCGVVLGEGAAYYLLENETYAKRSEALAWITGYSSTIDSYLITDPEPGGRFLAHAACEAIAQSGITPGQIDCVHAHGTGTLKNDIAECNAMKLIFGTRYREVPVFSLKAQVGHLIGACGAVELGAVLYSFEKQVVPATCNFETPDPAADLCVLKTPMKKSINYILKLNAAFGGQNTALVLKKAN
jgi:3-oxoacyl-[acyl-carrier-protein] synthase II